MGLVSRRGEDLIAGLGNDLRTHINAGGWDRGIAAFITCIAVGGLELIEEQVSRVARVARVARVVRVVRAILAATLGKTTAKTSDTRSKVSEGGRVKTIAETIARTVASAIAGTVHGAATITVQSVIIVGVIPTSEARETVGIVVIRVAVGLDNRGKGLDEWLIASDGCDIGNWGNVGGRAQVHIARAGGLVASISDATSDQRGGLNGGNQGNDNGNFVHGEMRMDRKDEALCVDEVLLLLVLLLFKARSIVGYMRIRVRRPIYKGRLSYS